jgi:hypothetical protein
MKIFIAALVIAAVVPGIASAKKLQKRAEETHIACTVLGCQPIPPGCGQTYGRTFSGRPTGYDVIVCPRNSR